MAARLPPLRPPSAYAGPPLRRPRANTAQNNLNADITKGIRLKKAVTNDRSGPVVAATPKAPAVMGAPPVPRMNSSAPSAPAVPRGRSNSDALQSGSTGTEAPPQLGGLFAGGMPKLRSRGGVATGGTHDPHPRVRAALTSL